MHGAPDAGKQDRGAWFSPSRPAGGTLPPSYYEIRVVGVLPPEALIDFERLTASVEPVETVLHGPLRDQAAMHGLLARLQTFGVQVLEVRRLHDPDPGSGPPPNREAG
jgi:hypothetical protein